MAEMLTPQQRMAVNNRGGKLLVSAAAGSGKTKVLVDRLLSYLEDPTSPANVDEFLIITYTKAAAAELRGKIAAKLSERIAEHAESKHLQHQMQRLYLAKISTVHSFCSDILREYAFRLDLPADFRVADENECRELQYQVMESILDNAYASADDNPDFRAFVDTQGLGRDDRLVPDIVLKVYNSARCHLDPEQWLCWCAQSADTESLNDAGQSVWGKFLIDDLKRYLDLQIKSLERCKERASVSAGMEKPAALLADTVYQLKTLRDCDSWDEIIRNKQIDYGRLVFSKKCTDAELAEQIKAVRSACKKGLEKKLRSFSDYSDQVLCDLSQSCAGTRGLIWLVNQFSSEYSRRKNVRRVLDFGDLEHKMLDLLLGKKRYAPTKLAEEIGMRFREIMVDEYQDSNAVQDAIFSALSAKRNNCFMVGDVKQSIYQFRLADPGIFIEKYNSYVDAETAQPGEGRRVMLSKNFRSSEGVIAAVNDVFSACMTEQVGGITYGKDEKLYEGISHIPLPEPEVELYGIDVQEDTYAEEARFTAQRVAQLLDGTHMVRAGDSLRPICPDDIVILLRSPGSVGAEFSYALEQHGIRCTVGGGTDLLQTEEIRVLRSILSTISNPLQDIPLIAVLTSRVFCFTSDDLAVIRANKKRGYFYHALEQSELPKSRDFIKILLQLRKDARICTLPQLLRKIFTKTRLDCVYSSMDDGTSKTENLYAFCQLAANYESSGRKDLDQFLDYIAALEEKGLTVGDDQKSSGAVRIMSIHKSKGLEFPVVFLCGLSRSFNQESARAQVLCDRELGLGLACVDLKQRIRYPTIAKRAIATKMISDSISEEMRVLYVAMTRPKDRLIMTYAAQNLSNDLTDFAFRMDLSDKLLLTGDVSCPGHWVLQTALRRTDAGEFFAFGGKPACTSVKESVWKVCVVRADQDVQYSAEDIQITHSVSQDVIDRLQNALSFRYPHMDAISAPSKHTATQLKGRFRDQEAAEHTQGDRKRQTIFRKPGFAKTAQSSIDFGNAMHTVMQYISYTKCKNLDGIYEELIRLVNSGFITQEQKDQISPKMIMQFFNTSVGQELLASENVLREFKFSILEDGTQYYPGLTDEKILLQGVVDCAMIDEDGIVIIDFKSDHVTPDTLGEVSEQYRSQIEAYATSMSRIYQKPVKKVYLYFFRLGRFVEMK